MIGVSLDDESYVYSVWENEVGLTVFQPHRAVVDGEEVQEKRYATTLIVERTSRNNKYADILVNGRPQRVFVGTEIVVPHTSTFVFDIGTVVVTKPTRLKVVRIR